MQPWWKEVIPTFFIFAIVSFPHSIGAGAKRKYSKEFTSLQEAVTSFAKYGCLSMDLMILPCDTTGKGKKELGSDGMEGQ